MIQYKSTLDLADALKRAESAHGKYEQSLGHRDEDWPVWYAEYMQQEQGGNVSDSRGFEGQ